MSELINKIITHLMSNDLFYLDWMDIQERSSMEILEELGYHQFLNEWEDAELWFELEKLAHANQTREIIRSLDF